MALNVKDIMELPSGQRMQLIAGENGLSRAVVSVEIADYEFVPGFECDMEPGSFVITSFLFAKDDPGLILSSIKTLEQMGMAGLAYKQILYEELPEEVIAYADSKDFPLFSFNKNLWFENIIFDIMYAVQFDDKVYLSEEKIDAMLSGHMNRSELDIILKGISLKMKRYVSAAYLCGDDIDAGRVLRSFYMLKGFHDKGLMVRFGQGLFLIITSSRSDHDTHRLILEEALDILGISKAAQIGMSDVHETKNMDAAFREGHDCYLASAAEGTAFKCFRDTGVYRFLLPALDMTQTKAFASDVLGAISDHPDLRETAERYVASGGEISATASALCCHQNTVRYRLGRIRKLTGLEGATDSELYMQLKLAIIIQRSLKQD
ncbi:MAG: PucR family transcriptional regulator [Bacillota bacterium]|nr:PucR family transcriptional regulator [Bacillota bacterium]